MWPTVFTNICYDLLVKFLITHDPYTVNYRYLDIAFLDFSLSRLIFESPDFLPSFIYIEYICLSDFLP